MEKDFFQTERKSGRLRPFAACVLIEACSNLDGGYQVALRVSKPNKAVDDERQHNAMVEHCHGGL